MHAVNLATSRVRMEASAPPCTPRPGSLVYDSQMLTRQIFHTSMVLSLAALTCACGQESTRVDPSAAASAAGGAAAATAKPAAERDPEIRMSLLPGVNRITPGEAFQLGVRFEIPHGWHIYWENPGDAGMATKVSVKGPAGYAVGQPRFPGPHRFVSAGDIVSYGWEGEAVIVTTVTAPPEALGDARFDVEGRWLACKDACIPGKATATTTLTTLDAGAAAPVDQAAMLTPRHLALLPRPASELGQSRASCQTADAGLSVVVPDAEEIEFFPARATFDVAQSFLPVSSTLELRLGGGDSGNSATLDGVLLVRRNDERRYYHLAGFCTAPTGI